MILIMSVEPGFGGQKFMPIALNKIAEAKALVESKGLDVDIQVDGGIDASNVEDVIKAGANIIVAGSAVYNGDTAVSNTLRYSVGSFVYSNQSGTLGDMMKAMMKVCASATAYKN